MLRPTAIDSDILRFIIDSGYRPGDQLPTIQEVSKELGVSVAKTREAMEIARALGMLEIKPGRGMRVKPFDFAPAVSISSLYAIGLDEGNFAHLRDLRDGVEIQFWEAAVRCLTPEDIVELRRLMAEASRQLERHPVQVPIREHRAFHMMLFSRLENPFVLGILEAFWDAYEAFGLHLYRDISYHRNVWSFHEQIVDAIEAGDIEASRGLLIEHMNLLGTRSQEAGSDQPSLDQRGYFFE